MQSFRTNDNVRLEILADPQPGQNMLRSPDFALGQWPWQSVTQTFEATTMEIDGADVPAMQLTTFKLPVGGASPIYSEYIPVTPGNWLYTSYMGTTTTSDLWGCISFYWYDENHNLYADPDNGGANGLSGQTPLSSTPTLVSLASTTAIPDGAAYVRMEIVNGRDTLFAGEVGDVMTVAQPMLIESATQVTDTPAWGDNAARWTNVLGDSSSITWSRNVMDSSPLTAVLNNPALDPSAGNSLLAKGKPIRLTVNNDGTWEPLYTGAIDDVKVDYERDTDTPSIIRTFVTITANDGNGNLSSIGSPQFPSDVADVTRLLAGDTGTGYVGANDVDPPLPWNVNGSTVSTLSGANWTPVATRANATLADQVLIARDTNQGYAWIGADGVLNLFTTEPSTAPYVTFTDTGDADATHALYSGISVGYDQASVVNAVTINNLSNDSSGGEVNTPFGPYVDGGSVSRNGAESLTVTTAKASATADWAQTYATAILTANATPKRKVSSVTVPVTDDNGIAQACAIDLCSRVNMIYGTLVNDTDGGHRVTGITHTLTANGAAAETWISTYAFADAAAQAQPLQVLTGSIDIGSGKTFDFGVGSFTSNGNGVISIPHGLGVKASWALAACTRSYAYNVRWDLTNSTDSGNLFIITKEADGSNPGAVTITVCWETRA